MASLWLRLYTEIKRDRKLRRLPLAQRWLYVCVLCIAKESPVPGWLLLGENMLVTYEDLADEAAISVEEAKAGMQTFIDQQMIEEVEGRWRVRTWDTRQYESDNSTERWRKWKENKDQRLPNVGANVTPTLPEAEADTDTDITTTTSSEPMIFERECLSVLKQTPNYPFSYEKDLQNVQGLIVEFPDVDILDELKKWAHRKRYDDPLTDKQKPRSQIRNWLLKARGFQKKGVKTSGTNQRIPPDKWANVDLKGLKPAD